MARREPEKIPAPHEASAKDVSEVFLRSAAASASALRQHMGRRVRTARMTLDFTQGELAECYGKTAGWIASIESGKAFAPPYLIYGLQTATKWPHGWFFPGGGDDTPPPPR